MKRSANFFSVLLINNSDERLNNSEVINNKKQCVFKERAGSTFIC